MTLKLPLSLLAFAGLTLQSEAALVNIATNTLAPGSRLVVTSSGSVPTIGSAVRIGLFPAGAPTISATTTVAQLNSLFVPIGESAEAADGTTGPFGTNTAAAGGAGWAFTINSVDNNDARFAATTRIYVLVLDAPHGSLDSAGNLLILSDPAWTIPTSGARTMTTAQIDSQDEVIYGTWGATALTQGAFNIPEPTTGVLGIMAGFVVVSRRRR